MIKNKTEKKIGQKWKSYISGIIMSNFISFNKIDKYFRSPISESTSKAIQENWIRILGIDYEIISLNLCKEDKPLGISLEGRNNLTNDAQEVVQRHFLRAIMPTLCIGATHRFIIRDELLEVSGLKIYGLPTKDVIRAIKKLPNYFQIVVGRSPHRNYDIASDYGGSEDNINSPIDFYEMDDDESSRNGTLRSVTSNYSTTSRDFGSSVSFGGMNGGQYENVREYLKNMVGWRGPLVLEFRKEKESLGLALDEIPDPKTLNMIIVFKIIIPGMKAGRDGRLHVGDRLLQVNGKSVNGIPFRQVCQWMKSAPRGRLIICICKPHFEPTNFDHSAMSNEDKYFYNTLSVTDKLPKLCEESETDSILVPPAPLSLERQLVLKKTENRLGIIFDTVDNGKHGSRIKKISRGVAKNDGTLQEGDFITQINGISLRIADKVTLDHCLKRIAADTQDYKISYITATDLLMHNNKYFAPKNHSSNEKNLYPDPTSVRSAETVKESLLIKERSQKLSFEKFDVCIENDHKTGLGLVICPSLNEPSRFISITDIHENSLADKSGLLKINDDIIEVNGTNFEKMSFKEAGVLLKNYLATEDILHFNIRRLISSDDECEKQTRIDTTYDKISQFPDLYFCSIKKSSSGYGFSLMELESANGVFIEKIERNSPAAQARNLQPGDRFLMINKCTVINSPKTTVTQLVKNSSRRIDLIMEKPKYREFSVVIEKGTSMSLGLNVAGGRETKSPMPIIESLVPNKTSIFSEDLFPGDFIVDFDGRKMNTLSHDEIIAALRSTGTKTIFKIFRQLPYLKRNLLDNVEDSEFPQSYLQACQYSVAMNKPIGGIKSFGITFTDVVILESCNKDEVLGRYKVVLSIEKNSMADKYASEIKPYDYLVSINEVIIDCDITCEDLKELIDSSHHVDLVFSREIPYRSFSEIKDYDSPVLLQKNEEVFSHSDDSSEEDLNVMPLENGDKNQVKESIDEFLLNDSKENIADKILQSTEMCQVNFNQDNETLEIAYETEKALNSFDNEIKSNSRMSEDDVNQTVDSDIDSTENLLEDNVLKPSDVEMDDTNFELPLPEPIENMIEKSTSSSSDSESEKSVTLPSPKKCETISEYGINLDVIIVPKLPNVELGFQIYGGQNGGPNGEALPVFVIAVEKNSCNWPADREEPLLKNGQHLIELNGTVLSTLTVSKIENLIQETEGELQFKILTFK